MLKAIFEIKKAIFYNCLFCFCFLRPLGKTKFRNFSV